MVGEGVANLLEPWPLKIVLDSVLRSHPLNGWLNRFIETTVGDDKLAILKFACAAVLELRHLMRSALTPKNTSPRVLDNGSPTICGGRYIREFSSYRLPITMRNAVAT